MDDLSFRPGTVDEIVFQNVYIHNEYLLPERLAPENIVVDVGAHIGSFCYTALQRGSEHVYGFEAEPSNYECAAHNLRSFGDRVQIQNKAVWRSDRTGDRLYFHGSLDNANSGGGNVLWATSGLEVAAVPFDEIVTEVTEGGSKRVTMLKMDCEASEFPILYTSQMLHLIDNIHGEFHEIGGPFGEGEIPERARVAGYERFTIDDLEALLQRAGFDVTWHRHHETSHMGMFFAARRLPRLQMHNGELFVPCEMKPMPGDTHFAVDIYDVGSNTHPDDHFGWWIWPAEQARNATAVRIACYADGSADAWLVRDDREIAAQSCWLNPDYQLRPLQQINLIWQDAQNASRIQSQLLLAVDASESLRNRPAQQRQGQAPGSSTWRRRLRQLFRR